MTTDTQPDTDLPEAPSSSEDTSSATPAAPSDDNADEGVSVEFLDEGPCRKRLKVLVAEEKVSEELETNYKQLRGSIQLPGFRKGKVPISIIKGRFGSKIEAEVQEEMVSSTFFAEIEKRELKVLGQPSFENIEFEPGKELTYEASIEIAPAFEIPEYSGIEVEAFPVTVKPEEVQKEIDSLLEQQTSLEPIDAGTQANDDMAVCHVEIVDAEGTSVFDRDEVYLKIGLDQVDNIEVDGLGEKLLSAKADETLEFEIDAPEDFPLAEVQGQKVTLKVRFLEAKRPVKPELNEEFLAQIGVESEETLRSEIEKNLETRRRVEEESRQEDLLVTELLSSVELDFPPSILERRQEEVSMQRRFRAMREGKSQEEVEALLTSEAKEIEVEAREELKRFFVLDAIADKETVLVTEDELARRITAIAMSTQRKPEEVFEEYREGGMLDELRGSLRREKVRAVLRKKAKVNQPDGGAEADSASSDGNQE